MATSPRERMTREERRRQLINLGLLALTRQPAHTLALDEIAKAAGISRGLLFHYFPSKADYFTALVSAAGKRVLRNTRPDPALSGDAQVARMAQGLIEQIERRREAYISVNRGFGGADAPVAQVHELIRRRLTDRVLTACPELDDDIVYAWWSYVEERALRWSLPGRELEDEHPTAEELAGHCLRALRALHAVP